MYLDVSVKEKNFAPSKEVIDIIYKVSGLGKLKTVTLEVYDWEKTLVYSNKMDASKGLPEIKWAGDLDEELYATPLGSPYTIKVAAEQDEEEEVIQKAPKNFSETDEPSKVKQSCGVKEKMMEAEDELSEKKMEEKPPPLEAQISVLYDSIEIVRGPWLATKEEYSKGSADWTRNRLNEMGFYGGTRELHKNGFDKYLDNALYRYEKNHPYLLNSRFQTHEPLIEGMIEKTLKDDEVFTPCFCQFDGNSWKEFKEEELIPRYDVHGKALRVYVEAIGYEGGYEDDFNPEGGDEMAEQFNDKNPQAESTKTKIEGERLNRPIIPLEAVIYLKKSDGKKVLAPEAVGKVRVGWTAIEPKEKFDSLPLDPSIHSYVRPYIKKTMDVLKDKDNRNCPIEFGGIRTKNDNWKTAFAPKFSYPPYGVEEDSVNGSVYVVAYRGLEYERCIGRAGLFFRPSIIAGDRYGLKVSLSFRGHKNQKELEKENKNIRYETTTLEVWRYTKFAAVVGWPLRDGYKDALVKLTQEYEQAYIHVDIANVQILSMADAIDLADYKKWLEELISEFAKKDDKFPGKLNLGGVAKYPLVCGDYKGIEMEVGNFLFKIFATEGDPPPIKKLYDNIIKKIRLDYPSGFILVDYRMDPEFDKAFGSSVLDLCVGMNDKFVMVNQTQDGKTYYILTHEVGHCFWLNHYENVKTSKAHEHYQKDHNCVMSYASEKSKFPHHKAASYAPNFCGKCNLKLRGWDIKKLDSIWGTVEKELTNPQPLKIVVCYDHADAGNLRAKEEIVKIEEACGFLLSEYPESEKNEMKVCPFNQDADPGKWLSDIAECDVYHQISHGSLMCMAINCEKKYKAPLILNSLIPQYPIGCQNDSSKSKLGKLEQQLLSKQADSQQIKDGLYTKLATPNEKAHPLQGAIQWTAKKGVDLFTAKKFKYVIEKPPKILAFLRSPLLGWDVTVPQMFILGGTHYVIAFRCMYNAVQGVNFSKEFYRTWALMQMNPENIESAFLAASQLHPEIEPVLFSESCILRVTTMFVNSPQMDICKLTWEEVEKKLYQPIVPKDYPKK